MKVFLLYPDRDFDSEQSLPPHTADLVQDLALNTLFGAMSQGDAFVFEVVKRVLLSSVAGGRESTAFAYSKHEDLRAIRYRQDILKDCLKNAQVIRQIYQIPIRALESKRKQWLGIFGLYYPGSILAGARNMLEVYFGLLRELRRIADTHAAEFDSEGFRRFFAMIQQELDDEYLATVAHHLEVLAFRSGVLVSAALGPGNEGTNYVLRKPNADDRHWMKRLLSRKSQVYSFTLQPRDDHGARALGELRDRSLNQAANAVAQAAEHVESFLNVLRWELAFYVGCLNLAETLDNLGEPIAFPAPTPADERRLSAQGLYDVTLALTMGQKVVGNDVVGDGKDLVMITGANQGGKSTFLRSIGLAQLMMQCGMFVPAQSFSANLCSGLFTHFKREEDAAMRSGKFDEELGRMSAIVDALTPNAMVLFNESFAATNENEGAEIAQQVVRALLERRIKVFFVTHIYEFARRFRGQDNVLFLRAERKPDGTRTFKLVTGEPLPTSYGPDLYHRIFETRSVLDKAKK